MISCGCDTKMQTGFDFTGFESARHLFCPGLVLQIYCKRNLSIQKTCVRLVDFSLDHLSWLGLRVALRLAPGCDDRSSVLVDPGWKSGEQPAA